MAIGTLCQGTCDDATANAAPSVSRLLCYGSDRLQVGGALLAAAPVGLDVAGDLRSLDEIVHPIVRAKVNLEDRTIVGP